MYLRSLSLTNFRNYASQQVEFSSPKTILVGENAQGKSNLLEAVEVLATLKSHRAGRDREFVRQGETAGNVVATVERLGTLHELAIAVRQQGRRSLRLDGQLIRRRAEFLGQLNAVTFSSLDLDLVRGSPNTRRDWLDGILLLWMIPRNVRFVVDGGNFGSGFAKWLAAAFDTILMVNNPKSIARALKTARQGLVDGDVIGIFPEGT
ncbi:MAG: AAA family ATPase, partial [Cyanobacteria bacterium P01_G01_bin.4]